MTAKEAIKHLDTYSTTNGSGQTSQEQHEEAKRMAIEALKKQTPKKPIRIKERHGIERYYLYCPSCKSWIGVWDERLGKGLIYNKSNRCICPYCGQAIDAEDIR